MRDTASRGGKGLCDVVLATITPVPRSCAPDSLVEDCRARTELAEEIVAVGSLGVPCDNSRGHADREHESADTGGTRSTSAASICEVLSYFYSNCVQHAASSEPINADKNKY